MSLRPSTTTVVRKKSYKTGVEIRKNKREDNLLKKRREGLAPSQQQLLDGTQTTVVFQKTVVWALGNVAGDSPSCRDLVLGQGALMPLLAQLNEHSKLSMVGNATWTLSNFCRGKPATPFDQVKPDLPILRQLIYLNDEEVLTDACWALSYLSDGPNDKIQAVIEAGVCQRLVDLLIHLASRGCIKPLCDLLICPDPRIITVCLEGPENILKVGEADKEMGMNDGINLYAQLVDECEGLDKIDNLQTHDNSEIYEKAVKILERDWAEEELDYNYTHDINVKVHEGFQRQFDEEYKKNVVITQGQTYTVRLVHFKNPIDELYERLERKNSQRVVLPEVRYLSSVRIEEIGEAPILCGKITQELVRNLQEI
ncbi:PREDICTED: importin subunit alpha-4-like [Prunus mume]|uniref:Importin subunit alpha-4-like n=1 Tax=Prunus mume TaxID=102107 RepID=A0ABM0PY56_PRUMU|nr:PREDICTED: importin subunit alpha-4-like [Prunus mume]